MKRILCFAAILLVGVFVTPSFARAGTPAEDAVINDQANFDAIQNLIATGSDGAFADEATLYEAAGGNGGTYDANAARQVVSGLVDAGEEGGVAEATIGAAEYVPQIVLAAGSFYVGWQVGTAIDHWLGISKYFGSSSSATTGGAYSYNAAEWVFVRCNSSSSITKGSSNTSAAGTYFTGNVGGLVYPYGSTSLNTNSISACAEVQRVTQWQYPFRFWELMIQRGASCTGTCVDNPSQGTWDNQYNCQQNPCTTGSAQNYPGALLMDDVYAKWQSNPLCNTLAATVTYYGNGSCVQYDKTYVGVGVQGWMWATQEQMQMIRQSTPPIQQSDPCGGCARQVGAPSPPVSQASCTYSSTCGTAIRNAVVTRPIVEKWIVHELAPNVEPLDPAEPQTFTWLQPNPDETYDKYLARLQADGYVGVASYTQEPTALDGYGPLAVTRITYLGQDGVSHTLDPLHWPTTVPVASTNTAVSIRYNPSTATPAPTEGGTSSSCGTADSPCYVQDNTTGTEDGGGDCATCAIDWTPIENLDVGSKFPFGVPNWVSGFFGQFTFSDSCPTLSIGKPAAIGGGSIDIPFCNTAWEDTYRPIVFPILEALMTLAAVAFLGSKILGIGGGEES